MLCRQVEFTYFTSVLNQASLQSSSLYKGLALFTPGGDLIYCIDPTKQGQWHLHLCVALQEILDLPEPPLFLTPCYTATLDRWLDPQTQQLLIFAEAYPPVLRHQAILNVIFEVGSTKWQLARCPEGVCDPLVLKTYRQQFPQLWQSHDLVIRFNKVMPSSLQQAEHAQAVTLPSTASQLDRSGSMGEFPVGQPVRQLEVQGYVLRLFVTGHSKTTEQILKNLHALLDESLQHPYTLKVIDVVKQPEQAEANQVSATPTLVKAWPRPVRRLVGDLDNLDKVLRMLSP